MINPLLEQSLKQKGYSVHSFKDSATAVNYLVGSLTGTTIGFGDSKTLITLQLSKKLSLNNKVIDPSPFSGPKFNKIAESALRTKVFITSANAITLTGEMVNIDSTGNRVAGSLFGHERVIFVIGTNKIEPTIDKAIWRARNMAAPINAKRFGFNTPCAINGDRCYDCSCPDRICNALTIYLNKMKGVKAEVILIDETLGF